MLKRLSISNYALIESSEINFDEGLTVVTGESGAGKSIMLESLGLLLGSRANFDAIRKGEEKCTVEAAFTALSEEVRAFLKEENLDCFDELIIRRELTSTGRSRAFINDTPVGLALLKRIGFLLIDLHGQQENLVLQSERFKCEQIDLFAKTNEAFKEYSNVFKDYKHLQSKIAKLKEDAARIRKDQDYIQFQLEELAILEAYNALSVKELETELNELDNASEIIETLSAVSNRISDDDGIYLMLQSASNALRPIAPHKSEINEIWERLKSVIIEVKELGADIENLSEKIEINPSRLEMLRDKLDGLNRLLYKHNVSNLEALFEIKTDYENQLSGIETFDEELKQAELLFLDKERIALTLAKSLSLSRAKATESLERALMDQLNELGMPKAHVHFQLSPAEALGPLGMDKVEMLFDANGNSNLQSIDQVASGGEVARLMLALKSLQSEGAHGVTLIFDEIDTGVSGEVAKRIGNLMNRLGTKNQIIAVTHLPGVAAKGHQHIRISKTEKNGRVSSIFDKLSKDERINELAAMFSGENLSNAALESAKGLLNSDN